MQAFSLSYINYLNIKEIIMIINKVNLYKVEQIYKSKENENYKNTDDDKISKIRTKNNDFDELFNLTVNKLNNKNG